MMRFGAVVVLRWRDEDWYVLTSYPEDRAMSLKGPMEWPQLASLCGGYLHQDLAAVHGSALNAVQAWLDEASPDDVSELSSEWRTFLNVTQGMELQDRTRALRELAGGAWEPSRARPSSTTSRPCSWTRGGPKSRPRPYGSSAAR